MSYQIQQQIRHNAEDIQDYIKDLHSWNDQITNKKTPKQIPKKQDYQPIRGNIQEQKEVIPKEGKFKRDYNNASDYYKAWDKYDVDGECEKLEQSPSNPGKVMFGDKYEDPHKEPTSTNRNGSSSNTYTQMTIKGGRGDGMYQVEQEKDKGNLSFRNNEYDKAIISYHKCIDLL